MPAIAKPKRKEPNTAKAGSAPCGARARKAANAGAPSAGPLALPIASHVVAAPLIAPRRWACASVARFIEVRTAAETVVIVAELSEMSTPVAASGRPRVCGIAISPTASATAMASVARSERDSTTRPMNASWYTTVSDAAAARSMPRWRWSSARPADSAVAMPKSGITSIIMKPMKPKPALSKMRLRSGAAHTSCSLLLAFGGGAPAAASSSSAFGG